MEQNFVDMQIEMTLVMDVITPSQFAQRFEECKARTYLVACRYKYCGSLYYTEVAEIQDYQLTSTLYLMEDIDPRSVFAKHLHKSSTYDGFAVRQRDYYQSKGLEYSDVTTFLEHLHSSSHVTAFATSAEEIACLRDLLKHPIRMTAIKTTNADVADGFTILLNQVGKIKGNHLDIALRILSEKYAELVNTYGREQVINSAEHKRLFSALFDSQ